jgi:hypothetical protein
MNRAYKNLWGPMLDPQEQQISMGVAQENARMIESCFFYNKFRKVLLLFKLNYTRKLVN